MTPKEMHFDIKRRAAYMLNTGWTVDINNSHPYVQVEGPNGEDHWFQGDEAAELLREAYKAAELFDCKAYECVLWYTQSW